MCVALPAVLQNPQKNTPLEFWSMYLMGFIDFCCLYLVVGFRVSQQGACVLRCLRRFRTSEKHAPGFLEHVPYVFYGLLFIFVKLDCLFCGFRVSQQGACALRCLRCFRTLRKTRPWNFGACALCVFRFYMISSDFIEITCSDLRPLQLRNGQQSAGPSTDLSPGNSKHTAEYKKEV